MKAAFLLVALWQTGVAFARGGHNHGVLHGLNKKDGGVVPISESGADECTCVTSVVTWYGDATLIQPSRITTHLTSTATSTYYSTVTLYEKGNSPAPYTSFSATGVYTVPATTITLTSTVVVPCPTTSSSDTYGPGIYSRPETTLTVTETNSVYVCPFTTVSSSTSETAAPPPHPEAPAPPAQVPEPTQTPASSPEAPAPAPSSPTEDKSSPSTSASSASVSASPSSSGGSGSSPIFSNGNKWAMSYSPYSAEGGCKDAGAVSADISSIKAAGFTTVRLYSTDCSGLEHVGNACKANNLKLVLGVFIDSKGIDAARPQVEDIISWGRGQWEMVELIVIGNEAVFNKHCDAGALVSFIAESRGQIKAAGYGGLFTTTETINILQEVGSLFCDVVDVLAANIHPFFNSEVSPDQAGSFTAGQVDLVSKICPGKEVYNLESGWPHGGQANGKATPGPEHQKTAIKSIMDKVGAKTTFFSFEDDMWKQPGQFGVEQSWGCNKLFLA